MGQVGGTVARNFIRMHLYRDLDLRQWSHNWGADGVGCTGCHPQDGFHHNLDIIIGPFFTRSGEKHENDKREESYLPGLIYKPLFAAVINVYLP